MRIPEGCHRQFFLPIHCHVSRHCGQTSDTVTLSTRSVILLLRGQARWMDLIGPEPQL